MLDLSIIIVGYNNAGYLEDCLSSLFGPEQKAQFEVIYIDNNSSDHSVELIRTRFPKVSIIENRSNRGFSAANNQGLKIFRGRFAVLLNTDTVVKAGALDRLLSFMRSHPKAGACGPRLLNRDGSPQHQGGMLAKKFWRSDVPIKVDYVIGACLMVRREVIDIVGGMDENLFFSNDDLDWCRSIRKAGWDIYFIPQAEVIHFGGYTIKKFNQRLFVEGFRGGLYFCRKHYGPLAYHLYRCLLVLLTPLAIVLFIGNRQKAAAFWQIFWISLLGRIYPARLPAKNILLVSNGHAEDLAAAAIGEKLREIDPEIGLKALPLVGLGKAYDKKSIRNLGLHRMLPSGGFAKEGLSHLAADLIAGLPWTTFKQTRILKREGKKADLIVGVGDAYLVALCGLFGKKPLLFVDGPKSVKIEGYLKIEEWLMRKFCRRIIVQDSETAEYLKKKNLPAEYLGSWVMDYVPATGEDFGLEKEAAVIGILPGTRDEAYDNLSLCLAILDQMARKAAGQKLIGLVASTLYREKIGRKIKAIGWTLHGTNEEEEKRGLAAKLASPSGALVYLAEGKFADVCKRSSLIIGLAGIANEQAVAFGKPVVCFVGSGPQTTQRRWEEIQKITGKSMEILPGSPAEKAAAILSLLDDHERMRKMEAIGRASKPQWGGVARIAARAAELLDKTG